KMSSIWSQGYNLSVSMRGKAREEKKEAESGGFTYQNRNCDSVHTNKAAGHKFQYIQAYIFAEDEEDILHVFFCITMMELNVEFFPN
ncbi:hypothetical protein L9F63_024138, partial [Diploptera punctata]